MKLLAIVLLGTGLALVALTVLLSFTDVQLFQFTMLILPRGLVFRYLLIAAALLIAGGFVAIRGGAR